MTRAEFDRQSRRLDEIADLHKRAETMPIKLQLEREYKRIRRRLEPYISGERRLSGNINTGFSEGGNA